MDVIPASKSLKRAKIQNLDLSMVLSVPPVVPEQPDGYFLASEKRERHESNKVSDKRVEVSDISGKVAAHEQRILSFLRAHQTITSKYVETMIGVKEARARRILNSMTDKGLVEKQGSARSTCYVLAKHALPALRMRLMKAGVHMVGTVRRTVRRFIRHTYSRRRKPYPRSKIKFQVSSFQFHFRINQKYKYRIECGEGFCNNVNMKFVDTIEVGTRIRAIREQNTLTLKELANRTGLDVGQLSRIESSKVGARDSTFRRIAVGLGVPPDTFILKMQPSVQLSGNAPEPQAVADRAYAPNVDADEQRSVPMHMFEDRTPYSDRPVEAFSVCSTHLRPQTSHDTIIARENCRAALQATRTIEGLAGVTPRALLQLALPILPTALGAGLLARQVRTMLGIGEAVCYDYFELFARHGIRTLELHLPEPIGSLSSYDAPRNQATIFIATGLPVTQNTPERKVYSLVTELAGILMENARRASILEAAPASEKLSDEKFTRHFAALFLLPAEAVRETLRQYRLTPERWTYGLMLSLKNRFGVSAQAFCYRLLELGCITDSLAADFRARIEAHYETVRASATQSASNANLPSSPHSRIHEFTHSRISPTNAFPLFEPSPTDRAARLNAFLCDLIQLMPPGSVNEPDSRAALRMLKQLGCIEKSKV